MSDKRILKCHCGAVEVEVNFDNGLVPKFVYK